MKPKERRILMTGLASNPVVLPSYKGNERAKDARRQCNFMRLEGFSLKTGANKTRRRYFIFTRYGLM
jgi:hypothetical protein